MARIIDEKEYARRRNEILDIAQRLVYSKGYEQMTIQDILDNLQISKGAFYHYFGSNPALLEALIEHIQDGAEMLIIPILQDAHLSAIEKLERFFATAARWKTEQKDFFLALLRVWYTDDNAIVRQKTYTVGMRRFLPELTGVIYQGIR